MPDQEQLIEAIKHFALHHALDYVRQGFTEDNILDNLNELPQIKEDVFKDLVKEKKIFNLYVSLVKVFMANYKVLDALEKNVELNIKNVLDNFKV